MVLGWVELPRRATLTEERAEPDVVDDPRQQYDYPLEGTPCLLSRGQAIRRWLLLQSL